MKLCDRGGLLVGPQFVVPMDRADYQSTGRTPPVGCNHIACGECGAIIRCFTRTYLQPPEKTKPDYRAIYDAFAVDSLVKAWPQTNLYLCHCRREHCDGVDELGQVNDLGWRRYPTWSCAGHR